MPGWEKGSWAYHGDDGNLFLEEGRGVKYGDTYGTGDVIGCGADYEENELFFTKNGEHLGKYVRYIYCFTADSNFSTAGSSRSVPNGRLFAVVGIGSPGVHFSVNFGETAFRYNL
jgi:hypothetical protein